MSFFARRALMMARHSTGVTLNITRNGSTTGLTTLPIYIQVGSTRYTDAATLQVEPGQTLILSVKKTTYSGYDPGNAMVIVNGTTVLTKSAAGTYTYNYIVPQGVRTIIADMSWTKKTRTVGTTKYYYVAGRITVTTS